MFQTCYLRLTVVLLQFQNFRLTVSYGTFFFGGGGIPVSDLAVMITHCKCHVYISCAVHYPYTNNDIFQKSFLGRTFSQASLLVSMDKIIANVSMDKSKWCVAVDGNIHQTGYILFYVQLNQKTVSYGRKPRFR